MRKIREVLRLYFAAALSIRAIARSVGTSPSTVADYLRRAKGAGLSWPVPRGDRRRRAGTATVSGFAAEQPVASAAGVERGAPGVNAENRHDLLKLLEDRHAVRSTVVTSQLPVDTWHDVVGDPTLADAICAFPPRTRYLPPWALTTAGTSPRALL